MMGTSKVEHAMEMLDGLMGIAEKEIVGQCIQCSEDLLSNARKFAMSIKMEKSVIPDADKADVLAFIDSIQDSIVWLAQLRTRMPG